MNDELKTAALNMSAIGSGLLGAVAYGPCAGEMIKEERLRIIERRILRIEMALRRAGIEVDMLDLPS